MKAAEGFIRRAIALDSTQPAAYLRLVDVLLTAGRLAAARGAVDDLARRFPEWIGVPQAEAKMLYSEGRHDEVRAAWLVGSRSREGTAATWADDGLARLDLTEGRVAASQRDFHASIALDSAAGRHPVAEFADLTANYWVLHRAGESLRDLDNPKEVYSREAQDLRRAILYAQYDQPDRARALLAAHDSAVKEDTLGGRLQGTDRKEALGWIFLAERRPLDAVVAFRASRMLSDGPSNASPIAGDVEMGIAFERSGMPDSAITAYEHYMNTPWADHVRDDGFRLPWALEHVAALYDAKGNTKKAISAYQRLADLWRQADPELQPRDATPRPFPSLVRSRTPIRPSRPAALRSRRHHRTCLRGRPTRADSE
jgi:tetratricopeptide (TPR) repeat protein